jgi:mono/diheme cytochrome c family protein
MKYGNRFRGSIAVLSFAACMALAGCERLPGRPQAGPEVARPEEVVDFPTLYKENCAGCHGANGGKGASIPLNNPMYLAVAGQENIRRVIAKGVPGSLMPAFAKGNGGTLTDPQIDAIVNGLLLQAKGTMIPAGQSLPPYAAALPGNADRGQQAFTSGCARCHGAAGEGGSANANSGKTGSIVDPSYLALISDQELRSTIIAGRPDEAMPDWRTDGPQPLTDQQITDIVAWLASKRIADPGQPYRTRP